MTIAIIEQVDQQFVIVAEGTDLILPLVAQAQGYADDASGYVTDAAAQVALAVAQAELATTNGAAQVALAEAAADAAEAQAVLAQTAAVAAQSAISPVHYGSVMMPVENGESTLKSQRGMLYLSNSSQLTQSGATALWNGPSSFFIFWDAPIEALSELNRTPILVGNFNAGAFANNTIRLAYFPHGYFSAAERGKFRASMHTWQAESPSLPATAKGPFVPLLVTSADASTMALNVLDVATGTWHMGAPVARPASYPGIVLISHDFCVGDVRPTLWPIDYAGAAATYAARGAFSDLTIADKVMTTADIEAIVAGADPVAQAGGIANVRLYAPLAKNGAFSSEIQSNRTLTGHIIALGKILPGGTLRAQTAAKSLRFDDLPSPAHFGRGRYANVAIAQFTGPVVGLTGQAQMRFVHDGRVHKDWHDVAATIAAGKFNVPAAKIPCPCPERFQAQIRFSSDTTVVASTSMDCQAGPVVAIWGQSGTGYAVVQFGNGGGNGGTVPTTVAPEGDADLIVFAHKRVASNTFPSLTRTATRPGFLSSAGMTIANYIRAHSSEPHLIVVEAYVGTSKAATMNDLNTTRQWADTVARFSLTANRNPNGSFVVTGHYDGGWIRSDFSTDYANQITKAWLLGSATATIPQADIDHFVYDGTFSPDAPYVAAPAKRYGASNPTATDTGTSEMAARNAQRNGSHVYGYINGPEMTNFKSEGEPAEGTPSTVYVPVGHPRLADSEGDIRLATAIAEGAGMAVGWGSYGGPRSFVSARLGSAANKVIVTLGPPRRHPGLAGEQPINVPVGTKLLPAKPGGNLRWNFEARLTAAGSFAVTNVTAASTAIDTVAANEVELTLNANVILGETAVVFQPGYPGAYPGNIVTPDDWRAGSLTANGWPVATNGAVLLVTA